MSASRLLKTALSTGLPFGLFMAIFFGLKRGTGGIVTGALAGLLFGGAMAVFTEVQRRRFEITGGELDGEALVHQGPANHWLRGESRGGWLVLTAKRLVFRAHGFNAQNQPLAIPVTEIESVATSATLGFVPNGLSVTRRSGALEKFVVSRRGEWVTKIDAVRRA